MSRQRFATSGSVDFCVETPLVNITTVAAAPAVSLPPMSPLAGGPDADWLDPRDQWSPPYRVRRSSYVIATQDVPAGTQPSPRLSPRPSPDAGGQSDQSPTYERPNADRDLDLPGLLTLPLASPGDPWTPTSADSLSPMPTPRHWDSSAFGDDRQQPEIEISSLDCPTTSGSVGNHVNYSGRNALLMISAAAASDAITPVETAVDSDAGWCNACHPDAAKTPETELSEKTTLSERARQPANAVRHLVVVSLNVVDHLVVVGVNVMDHLVVVSLNVVDHLVMVGLNAVDHLVVVGLSCVLVVSGFRSSECLQSSLNATARLGVLSLCLMHAAAAGTCYVAPVTGGTPAAPLQ